MIENDIPMPENQKEKKKQAPAKKLIDAINFIKPLQKLKGSTENQFCMISHGWIAATDGKITIAAKIEENLNAFVHTFSFLKAMKECKEEFSITQLNARAISISSGPFKAVIPCCASFSIQEPFFDNKIAAQFEFKQALKIAVQIAPVKSRFNCILITPFTIVGTNNICLIESKHETQLSRNILISQKAAKLVTNVRSELTYICVNEKVVNFIFENGNFIQTELEKDNFPQYEQVFEISSGVQKIEIPVKFRVAAKAIASLTTDEHVFFKNGRLATTENEENESLYKIEGLPDNLGFNSKELVKVCNHFNFRFEWFFTAISL